MKFGPINGFPMDIRRSTYLSRSVFSQKFAIFLAKNCDIFDDFYQRPETLLKCVCLCINRFVKSIIVTKNRRKYTNFVIFSCLFLGFLQNLNIFGDPENIQKMNHFLTIFGVSKSLDFENIFCPSGRQSVKKNNIIMVIFSIPHQERKCQPILSVDFDPKPQIPHDFLDLS